MKINVSNKLPSTLSTAEIESLKVQTWAEQGHSVWGREGLCLLVSNLIGNLYATLKYAISTLTIVFLPDLTTD